MTIALICRSGSQWHAGTLSKAGGATQPRYADVGFVGHWFGVAERLGTDWLVLDGLSSIDELSGVTVLIFPVPDDPDAVTSTEAETLARHLATGGGLLLIGDRRWSDTPEITTGSRLPLGIGTGAEVAGPPVTGQAHILSSESEVAVVHGHHITEGLTVVSAPWPRVVTATRSLTPLVIADDDPIVACATVGTGRIVAVGNAEMFALPFVGLGDNMRLLANILAWLSDVPAREDAVATLVVSERRLLPRPLSEPGCLAELPGAHMVDSTAYRAELETVVADGTPDPYWIVDLFAREAEERYEQMPFPIRRAVTEFRREPNDHGVLLIRGLPADTAPETPVRPDVVVRKSTWRSEFWLTTFAQALGSPFAYRQQMNGTLYQNVVPTRRNAEKLSSESSSILLDYHSEAAFHPFKPDFILLYCVRPDHDRVARTLTAGVRMIVPRLSARDRALLGRPLYRTGIDYSFGSANGQQGNGPLLAVLTGDPYDPQLTYDLDLMIGLTNEADNALRAMREATAAAGSWTCLDVGDLLIIDNRRAVHARTEFTARYDGMDRWLQRTCVAVDNSLSAAFRYAGSPIINVNFSV